MANQNPQPEIYTTSHFFDATAEGATNTQTIFTQQANNEEVRIYGFGVDITNAVGTNLTTNIDFDVEIQIGNSKVPFTQFPISQVVASDTKTFFFSCPILVLFQQPISVKIIQRGSLTTTCLVKVSFIAELSLQEANCLPGEKQFPRE
jgi:hypothetical protein|tara:strand:+ start:10426 stop:10869 length:444 start_codon:yes stop_codon:yes gene_type:complete